jgi:hypothetical protein
MNYKTRIIFLILACICIMLFISCGRKANPRPPEERAPSPVRFLTATAGVGALELSWEAPLTNARGEPLTDLAGFLIKRKVISKNIQTRYSDIAKVEIEFEPMTEGSIWKNNYSYRDEDVKPRQRYEYAIVPYNVSNIKGEIRNILIVTFIGEASVIETF